MFSTGMISQPFLSATARPALRRATASSSSFLESSGSEGMSASASTSTRPSARTASTLEASVSTASTPDSRASVTSFLSKGTALKTILFIAGPYS